jgi:hypothetical protein
MRKITRTDAPMTNLPPDVKAADLKFPEVGKDLPWERRKELGLEDLYGLTFYQVKGLGWVLCTLHISNPSRRASTGTPARTYAIGVADGKVYTVGRGPHVTKEIEVYLSVDNLPRIQRYVDLWKKGMEDAGQIRDRISSRRAQGQMHRAQGRTSWMW